MSSELAPNSIATPISAINSPAWGPIICAPNTLSVISSAKIFTKPYVSSMALALELAINENLPTLYFKSRFFNCSSVFPTDATSGLV